MYLIQQERLKALKAFSFKSYFVKLAATLSMMESRVWVGAQPIEFLIFVISGTRRCISSNPAG